MCSSDLEPVRRARSLRERAEGSRVDAAGPAHLVLEVRVVLQDRALVSACPHVVLHHVLLLGQVAIKLEQRHANGTGHAADRWPRPWPTPWQRRVHFRQRSPWGGRTPSAGLDSPATGSSRGSWKLEAAPREDTTTVTVAKGHSWLIPGPGSNPGELRICHTQDSGIKGHLPHLRGPKEVEEWIKQNPRTQSARQVRCCGVSL